MTGAPAPVETVGLMITSLVVINCLARGVSGPDTWYMGESQLGSFLKEREKTTIIVDN